MMAIYTDGACNNLSPYGEGGWAFVMLKNGEKVLQKSGCQLRTTNNRMELKAVIEGIKHAPKNLPTFVVTDSMYVIYSSRRKRHKLGNKIPNLDLIIELLKVMDGRDITFNWVKGHNGDEYNELADMLAEGEREALRINEGIPVFSVENSPKIKKNK